MPTSIDDDVTRLDRAIEDVRKIFWQTHGEANHSVEFQLAIRNMIQARKRVRDRFGIPDEPDCSPRV